MLLIFLAKSECKRYKLLTFVFTFPLYNSVKKAVKKASYLGASGTEGCNFRTGDSKVTEGIRKSLFDDCIKRIYSRTEKSIKNYVKENQLHLVVIDATKENLDAIDWFYGFVDYRA